MIFHVFNVFLDIAPGSWALAFLTPVLAVLILAVATGILIKVLLRKQAAENKEQVRQEAGQEEQKPEKTDK